MTGYWLHRDALAEFNSAVEYFESRNSGLGEKYRKAVASTLKTIMENPGRWPAKGRFRSCIVPVFNYRIYYEESDGALHIVAIAHPSRRPGYWKERVLDEQR